uniref:Uncharacterized protein n=1 Tax=Noctiluca scintillans TaxID=2966 RepID=A0A7S0ZPN0_NOCSC|mmetsp:Transcript_13381/g.36797  ORF Transcript_13381/g.36797 Transcript_13381/m.36797 type:complete len:177 (+) Transcript_13381:77-607(+)
MNEVEKLRQQGVVKQARESFVCGSGSPSERAASNLPKEHEILQEKLRGGVRRMASEGIAANKTPTEADQQLAYEKFASVRRMKERSLVTAGTYKAASRSSGVTEELQELKARRKSQCPTEQSLKSSVVSEGQDEEDASPSNAVHGIVKPTVVAQPLPRVTKQVRRPLFGCLPCCTV